MMIIGGGDSEDKGHIPSKKYLIEAAVKTGSVLATISHVPDQPIDFLSDDKEGCYEDDLIAYGWRQFMENGASPEYLD